MAAKNAPPPPPSASSFLVPLLAGFLLLNFIVAALATSWLHEARTRDVAAATTTTQNLARILEHYISGTIAGVDLTLQAVADQYAAEAPDVRTLDSVLARHLARQPALEGLHMADAEGVVRHGTDAMRAGGVSVAEREYFVAARGGHELAVSKPLLSRLGDKRIIVLARRVDRADGSFAGVVFASLALDHLSRVFANLDVGANGAVALRDDKLALVARYPELHEPGGATAAAPATRELRALADVGRIEGTFEAASAADAVKRLYAYRKIAGRPFVVTVGLAEEDFLAAWRSEAARVAALVALFFAVTLLAARLLAKAWRRQMASTEALLREETKFHTLADFTYDWEYCLSADGREVLYMTPSCERITGYRAEEFTADPALLLNLVHPDDRAAMRRHVEQPAGRGDEEIDFRIVRRDGDVRWIAHACRAIFEADGKLLGRRVGNRDITERKRTGEVEARLRASLRRLSEIAAFAHLPFDEQLRRALGVGVEHFGLEVGIVSRIDGDRYEVVVQVSPPGALSDGQVFKASQTYCAITLAQKRVVAISHMGVSDYLGHPCYREFELETYIGAPVFVGGEIFGTVNFSSAQPYAREFDDGDREFVELLARWVGSAVERKRAEEQVEQLAYYDTLTGLPNRRMLFDRLGRALAQAKRFGRALAVMFLDLDDFKRINDALGHEAGDELLKEVALRLSACVRGGDTVSRPGGDEFVIVLAEIAEAGDAVRVAEKILAALRSSMRVAGAELVVTTSIGIAVYPVNGSDDVRDLLKKADKAMYAAKAAGRDSYRFFGDDETPAA